MALPVLGVVARLLLSSGTREAIKKYGQAAVARARAEIAKREAAASRTILGPLSKKTRSATAASRAASRAKGKRSQSTDSNQ